ncbi:hypothetical protein PENSPDRAFT_648039 [Peniophora sp. CONT]|nr:hypothetical protein PENSPDRAFT_648039 [Peniophora sp. CONT]
MYPAHHPSTYAHPAPHGTPQPFRSDYKSGVAFAAPYQPNRKPTMPRAECTAIFEAAFAQNPNGLRSEDEYCSFRTSSATLTTSLSGKEYEVWERLTVSIDFLQPSSIILSGH